MAQEVDRVEQWLVTLLAADTALVSIVGTKIYAYLAPQGISPPYVRLDWLSGTDTVAVGTDARRVLHTGQWLIRGIAAAQSMAGPLATIADRIDAVLHGRPVPGTNAATVADGLVFGCLRTRPHRAAYAEDGVQYRESGGIYEITTQV